MREIYLAEYITNVHVRNLNEKGKEIDSLFQRDVITGYPIINNFDLKEILKLNYRGDYEEEIFGLCNKKLGLRSNTKYNFFSARLLAIPFIGENGEKYLVTSKEIVEEFNELGELFGKDKLKFEVINDKININILEDSEFINLINSTPIETRHMYSDTSKTYREEILPKGSLFYFGLDRFGVWEPEIDENFDDSLLYSEDNRNLIYIDKNVEIGYGAFKITKLGN